VIIRPVQPAEYEELGALTLDAYTTLDGHVHEPEYEAELADVRTRAEAPSTIVLVAVDGDGRVLGGVTHVSDHRSPFAEGVPDDASAIRMLAVSRGVQGRGTGDALVRACIERAQADGKSSVVLHTTPWMTTAHRLYDRLGFRRDADRDWMPSPDVPLLGYRLDLTRP
jgi:ribosomal protein S18 acetylase RimI-like enzyme